MYFYCSESVFFDIGDENNFYCERCACICFQRSLFKFNKVTIHQLVAIEDSDFQIEIVSCFICNRSLTDYQNITHLSSYCDTCDEEKARIIHLLGIKQEIIEQNCCLKPCNCVDCRIAHNFICQECNNLIVHDITESLFQE